jgi:hypothetical protein
MKINEIIGEWMIMPQSIKPMGLIRKPGGGFDFKNKGNNRANEKAPPGREKQVKALKGKVDNPYAVAWASYNKSKNKTNEAPIEQDHNNPIAKPYVDMPEWKALHDMDDKIIDAYIKHKQIKEEVDQFAPARALGEAQSSLMHGLQMAQNIIKKDYKLAEVQAKVIAENWPPLIDKIQNIYKKEDAAGVGIITKQNTTKDVKPGDEYKNVKKLGLSK